MSKNIYNIAAGENFSRVFAQHLLNQTRGSPEQLVKYRIFLPTRRACRILRDAFLQLNDGKPLLLPIMSPIGEVDEQDLSLMMYSDAQDMLDIPEAISSLQRQLMLSKLIQSMPDFVQGADHALMLAKSLCQLIDEVLVEELGFDALGDLVPDEFAEHWQVTLDFLKIVTQHWPAILKENNLIEAVERRKVMLEALGDHWQKNPPDHPVFAVGSTGSIPAVRQFLKIVAQLPQGAVVLPGLDQQIDDDAWCYLSESHPQYILKKTISKLDVDRRDVITLGEGDSKRTALAHLVMLPSEVSGRWSVIEPSFVASTLDGLQYYDCDTEHQEASLIALLLRETLQESQKVCALVTPDRTLARRVAAACRRWNIDVDDSAGQSLIENDLGKFALLILNTVIYDYDPVALLALLKSPLCRLGREKAECRQLVSLLERSVLRKGLIIHSFDGLRAEIKDEDVLAFFDDLHMQLKIIVECEGSFSTYLQAHLQMMESLGMTPEQDGASRLWRGDAGETAAQLFTEMLEHGGLVGGVSLQEYAKIFRVLLQGSQVRSAYGVHPRLLILGQLEARLTHADRIIIGGLNEGSWTSVNDHDPWMSKPMRKRFGLPGSEQSIGIAAHDFVQNFSASDVILTRSQKVDRSPSIPVRWLSRLDTVLKSCDLNLHDLGHSAYSKWLDMIDDLGDFEPYIRPEPRPPLAARPQGASVTKIETWLQNPYAIYAYYVLGLKPLRPIIQDNDAALKGVILHEILDRYTRIKSCEDALECLVAIAQDVTREMVTDSNMLHYWWPKFYRIAEWFVQHEVRWKERAKFLCSEVHGKVPLNIDGLPFYLEGRADRIDRMTGGYALIDYKSGGSFSKSGLKKGAYPQMPLEALMIKHAAFEGVAKAPTQYLGYWKLSGGKSGGQIIELDQDVEATVRIVEDGLKDLVVSYRDVSVPFYCIPDLSNVPRFDDYALLSRLQEWATVGSDDVGDVV